MLQIVGLFLDFEGAKNIHDLKVLNWGFWVHGSFLTRVWKLELDLDMVIGLWYTHVRIFGSLSWFWRCKEHPWPLSLDLGLWRTLEVPDWGLSSWSWFGYGYWSLVHPWFEFWLSILILKVQRTSVTFKSWFGALEDAGGYWLEFSILILIWIWLLLIYTSMFWIIQILALNLDFEYAKNIHVL